LPSALAAAAVAKQTVENLHEVAVAALPQSVLILLSAKVQQSTIPSAQKALDHLPRIPLAALAVIRG
jgi:hypothetical protein